MVISILLLRPREGKSFSQSCTASKWQSQDLNPKLSDNKTILTILSSHHVAPDFRRIVDEHIVMLPGSYSDAQVLFCVLYSYSVSSVQFSRSVVSDSLRPHESQHARPPCPSPTPGVHSDSRPSSPWYCPAISSSVVPFSSCLQSLPASESFPMSQLFAWGGQSIGVSASASFPSKKSQGWSPSEWTGWISLQSRELSRVFSNTTVQKHQFFGAQLSSQSNSHIHTWLLEKS